MKTLAGLFVVCGALLLWSSQAEADVNPPVVDIEFTPDQGGMWLVDGRGTITAVSAPFHGDRPALAPGEHIVSMTPTSNGGGYWLFSSLGRVFTFGNAVHHGDMGGVPLNQPVIDSIATSNGGGYYMVAQDGGIFTFGNAKFYGSMGGIPLNKPVNGLAPTATGNGYWLVADDGGIFSFGDAKFYGSMGGTPLNQPVVGMIGQGNGYLMLGADGGVFNFGQSKFHGSLGGVPIPRPITAVAVRSDLSGYSMVSTAGTVYPFGAAPATGWPSYSAPGFGFLGAGTYVVGADVAPGTYRIHPHGGRSCYWERLSGFSGSIDDVIANSFSATSTLVTIAGSDAGFSMGSGCWLAVADLSAVTSSPDAAFGAGMYFVHRDIRPGTWRASTGDGCYWARLSGFGGGIADIIANDFTMTPPLVTISAMDLGFETTSGCGTWTRVG